METISKVVRFKKKFSAVMVDGGLWFVANEIAEFLGVSRNFVVSNVKADETFLLHGRDHVSVIKTVDNAVYRVNLINKAGIRTLSDYMKNQAKIDKANSLIEFIDDCLYADMKNHWDKHMKKISKKRELLPFEPETIQPDPDLFVLSQEERINNLEQIMEMMIMEKEILKERIGKLEASLKEQLTKDVVKKEDGRNLVDADRLMEFLKGTGVNGNVR